VAKCTSKTVFRNAAILVTPIGLCRAAVHNQAPSIHQMGDLSVRPRNLGPVYRPVSWRPVMLTLNSLASSLQILIPGLQEIETRSCHAPLPEESFCSQASNREKRVTEKRVTLFSRGLPVCLLTVTSLLPC
jgi:hypothetical protein